MPFFLILPLWLLSVAVSVPLLLIRRFRFAGMHILLGGTSAVFVSFVVSTLVLIGAAQLLPPFRFAGVIIVGAYLVSLVGGGAVGLLGGIVLAHRLNRRFGWWPLPPGP